MGHGGREAGVGLAGMKGDAAELTPDAMVRNVVREDMVFHEGLQDWVTLQAPIEQVQRGKGAD